MFKNLKGILAGILTGATLGLLFAPKKGEETRKNIKKDIKDGGYGLSAIKDTAKGFGEDFSDVAKDIYSDISKDERVKKGFSKAKEMASNAKDKAEELYIEKVPSSKRKEISKTVNNAKSTIKKNLEKAKETLNKVKKDKK